MRRYIVNLFSCLALSVAGVMNLYGADGIIETRYYKLCPGDVITIDKRQTRIDKDTILYDTIRVTDPSADSIYVYVVNMYPRFEKVESRILEAGTSFAWCDTTLSSGGSYERVYKTINGCDSIYRMHVTVEITRHFSICDGESAEFNGHKYTDAGTYQDVYNADTTYKIIVAKHPTQLYQQTGILDTRNPYLWQYRDNGEVKTDTIRTAGVYEHQTQNPVTGCNDIWRLILSEDETSYHFIERETICEDQPYSWHGKAKLNEQGVGQTIHYFDRYKTTSGYDSIYELILTVQPVQRRTQTIAFCGSIDWKGNTYTTSTVLTDTLHSVLYGCDSIITTLLAKGIPFHYHDTATITPGSSLTWRGRTITTSGLYEDAYTSRSGCDSIYSIGVGLKETSPQANMHTDRISICEGESYPWREKNYREGGVFVDTLFKAGSSTEIDSLYILELTVNKSYYLTERVGFASFPQEYRGEVITGPGEYTIPYTTSTGCDSIYTVHVDKEVLREITDMTICAGEIFTWRGVQRTVAGQYKEVEKDDDGNVITEYILNLTILPKRETRITADICRGSSYTFGDKTLTESGVYTYTYHEDGCDSMVILSLNVLNADTVTDVVPLDPDHAYVWPRDHKTYNEAGVYYHYGTAANGCPLTEILILTENHVDEVDTTATICPSELPFEWHGIRAFASGDYQKEEIQPDGSYVWYRAHLTVREIEHVSKDFVVCGDVNVSYNGKTYTEAGYFTDYLGCDTVVTIHIKQLPIEVYETNASLGGEHGYRWVFMRDGEEVDSIFYNPGTYEFASPNETTGCNDLWRLVLTQNETSYHFVEERTICEGEDYSWRGMGNLSSVPGTSHYFDEYQTRTGKDSIYELVLTVTPVKRTIQTKYFCGSIDWNGKSYSESAVVYDTIATTEGCYEIRRTNLEKTREFYSIETWSLVQGDSIQWHGQTIYGDGVFYDHQKTIHGCDSTYELRVEAIAAPEHTNMYIEQMSICHGDTLRWRDKDIWTGGRYVDTVKTGAKDSIFILNLNVWPSYKDIITRHLYTCGNESFIRYQGQDYWQDTVLLDTLPTLHGCDSIVRVYLHFNTALYLTDTVEIADTALPYTWHYRLGGDTRDTTLTQAGTYHHREKAEGGCYNREELVLIVYPTYLYEDSITICETELPYHWLGGPIEHRNDDLEHTVGTTKQYEYRYTSVNQTDSIYRLQLRIDPAPKDTVEIRFCEGEQIKIGDKIYVNIQSDSVYRDTLFVPNPNNGCDSIIYYDIYQYPSKKLVTTEVLHPNDTIVWRGDSITSPGWYNAKPDSTDAATGCPITDQLHVIQDLRETRVICKIDTAEDTHPDKKYPFVWQSPSGKEPDTLRNTGIYTDTVFDASGTVTAFYSLDLTITQPYDTIVYVHGCKNQGAWWRDEIFYEDTLFVDRIAVEPFDPLSPCDSVFHVHVIIDTVYSIRIDTVLCEYQLPLIIGKVNPDTIWSEGNFQHKGDITQCGCDSTIQGSLKIIPKLTRNDSTFVCESFFANGGVVTLGDTVHPAFIDNDGGKWKGTWEGKWTGVHYSEDTIVWDCDSNYHHHIIMRPSQKVPFDTTYYMCDGDSVQLFWPKTQWVKHDTVYFDTVPMGYDWTDANHGYSYHRKDYLCDSIVRWTVKFVHPEQKDTTAHILLGDSIWWGGAWRYYTGVYDSIGPAKEKNSDSVPCQLTYTMHLIADSMYYFRDTVDICSPANKTHNHIWNTGYRSEFNVPKTDTTFHVVDSLVTYDRRDSIYDLFVQFRLIPTTHLYDTICEGDSLRFDIHRGTSTIERHLATAGIYYDTVPGTNICDSVLIMHLYVHNRIPNSYREVLISDREAPYYWSHTWKTNGADTTYTDTLRASGEYRYLMPSIHGCDSIDSLSLTIHQTHVFRDTIDICAPVNKTMQHQWTTGYQQTYTTPLADDTAYYADTLETRIKYDSIYVLCVNFHQNYFTELKDTVCEGDSLRFDLHRGTSTVERWISTRGLYYDTIETRFGCDSILQLRLFVRDRNEVTHRTVHIPDTAAPYLWNHRWMEHGLEKTHTDTLRAPGEYRFLMPDIHGCDSIDSLSLYIHNTYLIHEDTIIICSSETPFTWQNRNDITNTCDLVYNALTTEGYDSIRTVHIEVLPVVRGAILIDTICEGDSVRFGLTRQNTPRYLNESGVYYDTLTSHRYGCDSIVELRLNVYPHTLAHRTVNVSIAEMPYVWPHVQGGDTIARDTLQAAGEYAYYFISRFGCDSVDSLSLHVHQTYLYRDSIRICASETPYEWEGIKDIYTTDEYTKYLQTHDGYDSILVRYIEVLPVLKGTILHDTICEGDSLRFGLTTMNQPRFLTTSGVYFDTMPSHQYGCDSIIELRLNVFPNHRHHSVIDIADTELPYAWTHTQGGTIIATTTLDGGGEYSYHFTTRFGCDSVDSLSLRVHQTYLYRDSVRICASETPYEWEGIKDIYTTGEYTKYLQTHDGYDSIRVRYIEVLPVLKGTILHDTICEGDSLRFGLTTMNQPRFLTTSGVYFDTMPSHQYGCDSIIELRLNVFPNHRHHSVIDIADTELPYAWTHTQGGTIIATTTLDGGGEYSYHFTTRFGCDSIDSLSLRVHTTYDIREDTIDLCSDATPFTWCDQSNIVRTGDYTYYGQTTEGYDSVRHVHINVWPVQYTTIRHTMCEGSTHIFGSKQIYLTEGGTYTDTLTTAHGCDSIVTLILTVNPPYFNTRTEHIIEGNSITWYGETYTESGTYTHYAKTQGGCDSTSILQLVVHPKVDTVVTVCTSELPYIWINKWTGLSTPLYAAGVYRNDTSFDANGERLYYGLQLIVNQPTDTTIYRSICADDGYDFNGVLLREAGEYRDTLKNASGCDSIIILHLNVLPKYYNTVERTIYEGESVEFEGKTYSKAGAYPVRYPSSFGCDSIIELRLTVNRLFDDSVSVCSNELPYIWKNKSIYESGVYRDTVYDSEGKRSVTGIRVTVLPTTRLEEPIIVSICEGTEYRFGLTRDNQPRYLTASGTYYDTLTAANGCDSIVSLVLQVQPVQSQTDYKTIFAGDSVEFYGQWYKESGHYEHKTLNALGCEDVHTLILTVLQSFNVDTTAYVCQNDLPFVWRNYEYSESGDYKLPISWTDSSRVTMTLHLQVNETFYGERNVAICEGDVFTFNGREYKSNGEFFDTIPSQTGCDSIIKYVISVHPVYDHTFEKHISDKEPYIFHDRELTNTGVYEWTGKSVSGCDSLEHLILTVHPSYFFSDTVDLCQSDSLNLPYEWHGYSITTSGKYTDSILTAYGFDSVYQLIINIHPSYFMKEQYEIGEGETLKIHGRDISNPAVYYDTLRTIHGCDSIYHIVVNHKRTREFTWNKVICQGEYYDFFGRKLTHTGKYSYTSQYKDSIVTLYLTVDPISITEERIVVTSKQIPYIHAGKIYEQGGVYTDTMINHLGCDSIHRLVLVVTDRYSEWNPIPLCPGSEIKIDGQVITEAGLYTFTRRSRVTGELDSIYRVEVYDAPAYDMPPEVRTICDGDTLFIGGKAITRAGHYDFALKTTEGCDSLLHLDLTVNPSYRYYTDVTIRDYESYTWMGKSYNEEGSYDRTWPTIQDCDSTYTLRLKVIPTQRFITVDTICEGQTFTWRGKDYKTDGYYTDTIYRPETFYSAIYTLQLAVMHPTYITNASVSDICGDDESFDISFTYTGARPTTYSIYFDQLAKNEGFEDVINKPFLGEDRVARAPVPTKKDVVYMDHTAYVRPNKYGMRLVLDNGVCGMSQSDSLVVLVKYPSWIIEQNWNDVVAPLKKEYNGGYEFSQMDWYINGSIQPNNSLGYLHSNRLKDGDEIVMIATRKGDNYSIPTCPLIISINNNSSYDEPILVYPTRAPRFAARITIDAPQGGEYTIYSSTGMIISSGKLEEGAMQVNLPPTCGMYFVRTTHGEKSDTHKVVIY